MMRGVRHKRKPSTAFSSLRSWRRFTARMWVVGGALLALAACGDDGADVSQATETKIKRAEENSPTQIATAEDNGKEYAYSPIGKRDPFRSYFIDLAEQSADSADERKILPTEEYELDQYRLTALVTGTSQPRAMVEDPQNRGHVLRVGTRLGKNGGRVARITNRGITVVEEVTSPSGERVKVSIPINLPDPKADAFAIDK